jgi:hypothetical protein
VVSRRRTREFQKKLESEKTTRSSYSVVAEVAMLRQIGQHEYEVTHLVLDEEQSLRLKSLMNEQNEAAGRALDEMTERARERVSDRPLPDLLFHCR